MTGTRISAGKMETLLNFFSPYARILVVRHIVSPNAALLLAYCTREHLTWTLAIRTDPPLDTAIASLQVVTYRTNSCYMCKQGTHQPQLSHSQHGTLKPCTGSRLVVQVRARALGAACVQRLAGQRQHALRFGLRHAGGGGRVGHAGTLDQAVEAAKLAVRVAAHPAGCCEPTLVASCNDLSHGRR